MFGFIPGELIALITLPGVVLHEIAHRLACDILKVPVYAVKYFSISSQRSGYVVHHETNNFYKSFLIGFAPLIVNSTLCILLTLPKSFALHTLGYSSLQSCESIAWLIGITFGANAFPSNKDLKNILSTANGIQYVLVSPLIFFVTIGNFLSFLWFDFIYALGISLLLPWILLR